MVRRIATACLAGVLVATSPLPANPTRADPLSPVETLRKQMRSNDYRRYDVLARRHFGRSLRDALKHCSVRILDTRPTMLLFRLDAAGNVRETVLTPKDDLARCLHAGVVERFPLPAPPADDYWYALAVSDRSRGNRPTD